MRPLTGDVGHQSSYTSSRGRLFYGRTCLPWLKLIELKCFGLRLRIKYWEVRSFWTAILSARCRDEQRICCQKVDFTGRISVIRLHVANTSWPVYVSLWEPASFKLAFCAQIEGSRASNVKEPVTKISAKAVCVHQTRCGVAALFVVRPNPALLTF